MIPWKSIVLYNRNSTNPLYLQIANAIVKEIKTGLLKPGLQLPSTRSMAKIVQVHRKTIVQAYSELDAQGWITIAAGKGAIISEQLPGKTPLRLNSTGILPKQFKIAGYPVEENQVIHSPVKTFREMTGFHDGPDVRLVPVNVIARFYKNILLRKASIFNLSYVDVQGKLQLRNYLATDMNLYRGMNTKAENIMVTRGSQMAIYLLSAILFSPNDIVVVGEVDYYYACQVFIHAGAKLLRIPVDEEGLDVDQIEAVCKRRKIRAVYTTSHHHYPTTVTLSAPRRMKLLALSEKYGFTIIEDDYDYEFHYHSNPMLPLASADSQGMVIYLGTFSKTISPSIRIGYVVGPVNIIQEMAKLRQIIDVQGDPIMEQTIAEMMHAGEIRRHLKKVLKEYKQRRDFFCALLKDKLSSYIDFKTPDGGLAIWAKVDRNIEVPVLSQKLRNRGIVLSPGLIHNPSPDKLLNCTRMGFGWMNLKEAEKAINILKTVISSWKT